MNPKFTNSPLRAIREKCLDCSSTANGVRFCPSDGLNCPTACPLWPFRFGKRPSTARKGPLAAFLDPKRMPDAGATLEKCVAEERAKEPIEGSERQETQWARGFRRRRGIWRADRPRPRRAGAFRGSKTMNHTVYCICHHPMTLLYFSGDEAFQDRLIEALMRRVCPACEAFQALLLMGIVHGLNRTPREAALALLNDVQERTVRQAVAEAAKGANHD